MPAEFPAFLASPKALNSANRPLRLRLAFPDGVRDDVLLAQRVSGVEAVCGGIEYSVLALALDASLPLKEFIGVPAEIQFVTDRGDIRSVCGIVAEARAGNSDGGLGSYLLVVRDAMALMDMRVNSRVFRNKNEVEVIQALFAEWVANNPVLAGAFELEVDPLLGLRKYPQREFIRQHNESDAHFVRRLMKRRGIAWLIRVGHSRTGSANQDGTALAHTLVLFDGAYTADQNKAGSVRFHRDDATEKRDTITAWSGARQLRPGRTTRHSWDYRDPRGHFATVSAQGQARQGQTGSQFAASLDDYLVEAPHAGNDGDDLFKLGQIRIDRHDYETKCFHGEGSVRDFCAGEYFALEGHPEIDRHPAQEREFVIVELHVHAVNNLPSDLARRAERLFDSNRWDRGDPRLASLAATADASAIRSRNAFTAVRRGVRIVPDYDPRVDLPPTPMESALVVGPQNEEVHCDRMGRVKIRFPSARAADHEHARGAGASNSDADSAWVRVASNWAGNGPGSQQQCGTLGLPRVGSEVLVACLGGDPDKPIIVGQLYNELAPPPGISEMGELPGNRYLSGLRSREVGGSRANRLQLDDTPGQISAQLASDHGHSALNLGWLTQPRAGGEGQPRGEGAELRSDKAVAVRGAKGVFISADKREMSAGSQLGRDEMIGIMDVLRAVAEQMSSVAATHLAGEPAQHKLSELIDKLKRWETSSNTDGNLSNATQAAQSGGGEPLIALSAPAGVMIATQENLALGAQTDIDMLSGGDIVASGAGKFFVRAARGISLFCHQLGMKLISASGKIEVQTHTDDIEVTSAKRIVMTASSELVLQAPKIMLVADGAQIDLAGGAITQQSRTEHTVRAPTFAHVRGAAGASSHSDPPHSELTTDELFVVREIGSNRPVEGAAYTITLADGSKIAGQTNSKGETALARDRLLQVVEIEIENKNSEP